jgi:hypothetical protein
MGHGSAVVALEAAWAAADRVAGADGVARLGIFGSGIPESLIAAAGAIPVHVSFGRAASAHPMQAVIEPFVDHEVQVFLNRFALGEFNAMAGIVFARDDAAALIAYQYANEWVRQGHAPDGAPGLFLFNFVHAPHAAASRFNAIQTDKLVDFLCETGLTRPDNSTLSAAANAAARRAGALQRLAASVPAAQAARWRQAGRFMAADRHSDLLEQAGGELGASPKSGPRLALVGSALDATGVYEMLDRIGDLVVDLQAHGHIWPGAWETSNGLDAIRASLADDPFCPRIVPPHRHRHALLDAIVDARCDLVICQLAQTDDTFGWEVPALAAMLAERGIGFVNLGFRDPWPDAEWLAQAEQQILAARDGAR